MWLRFVARLNGQRVFTCWGEHNEWSMRGAYKVSSGHSGLCGDIECLLPACSGSDAQGTWSNADLQRAMSGDDARDDS
jgi:hypothetical protein